MSHMEDSSDTENNHETELENGQQFAEPVKTENESSTFDFAESSWMSDFVLRVEGTRYYVAKNILALASPVFERMFQSEFKESSTNELELPGKGKNDVLEFLRCIYPDAPANLSPETALSILPLTEEYQVLKLKKKCEKALIESIDSTTPALKLLQVLQKACLFELRDLRKKCVDLVPEKSTVELDEATKEYEVPAEALVEILGKDNEKQKVKIMEFEALIKKQRKEIEELKNENNMIKETQELMQQYFATECKVTLSKEIGLAGQMNWRTEQVVLFVNLKDKSVATVKDVVIWDTNLKVSANVSEHLGIKVENKGDRKECKLLLQCTLVCRQPSGKNETLVFCDKLSWFSQYIRKTLKKVNEINEMHHGFKHNEKIGLLIQICMSEPNTD